MGVRTFAKPAVSALSQRPCHNAVCHPIATLSRAPSRTPS